METAIGILAAILGAAILYWYVRRWVRYYKSLYAEAKAHFKKP
jgi:biopolymer transport protein ExbB/TolQ